MDETLSLHLRRPQLAASGLRLTLLRCGIEDVAADPGSGEAGYGFLTAFVELSLGAQTQTVEILSPIRLVPSPPVVFAGHRVSFVSSAGEYSKDPVVVVRVERAETPR